VLWWFDKKLRELRKYPPFAISDLPEVTIGRIVGTARPLDGRTIEAPVSGRPCLAYFAAITELEYRSELALVEEHHGIPFLVEDDSGIATIDPAAATCALDVDHKSHASGGWGDLNAHQSAFLHRIAADHRNKPLRWREAIVEVGEQVAVVGFGQRIDGSLRMSSSPHFPLVICDNAAIAR